MCPWIGDPDWLRKWAAEWGIPYRPHTHPQPALDGNRWTQRTDSDHQ